MVIINLIFPILLFGLSIYFTKNKYNAFLISNLIGISTTFFFPAIAYIIGLDIIKSPIGLAFNLTSYLFLFIFYLIGRDHTRKHSFLIPNSKTSFFKNLYWFSLLVNLLFVAYMVSLYGIAGTFLNSRFVIYTESRVGSGQIFYVAATFFNIYAICGLFFNKRKWLHILSCVIFALPYGSKAKIIIVVIFLLIYLFNIDKNKAFFRQNRFLIILAAIVPVVVFLLFWLTSFGLDNKQILELALGFGNEYQTNFSELINNFDKHFTEGYMHGRILLEEAFYPFLPRVIWPEKPMYFGSLYISYRVYPEITELNLGAPSFGPFGQAYADFGLWGLIQIMLQQALLGFLLGRYEVKMQVTKDIRYYILLICVGFGGIIGLGGATNPVVFMIVNLIFAKVLIFASRIVLKPTGDFSSIQ